jgi:hypothetical protein
MLLTKALCCSKLFTVLTKEYDSRRKLILTGTPLQVL